MSSHLLGEVQEVCDDVALLNHGELLIRGSVRELSRGADTSIIQATFLHPATQQALEALAALRKVDAPVTRHRSRPRFAAFRHRLVGISRVRLQAAVRKVYQFLRYTEGRPVPCALTRVA